VTLRQCQFDEQLLPPKVSCGTRCPAFPACLPPPSPELVATVVRSEVEARSTHDNQAALIHVLSYLHDAITTGLIRKEEQ